MNDLLFQYSINDIELPSTIVPNLKTGEGHGHYRPLSREKLKKNFHKYVRDKKKMSKKSRRRNRK